MRRLTLLAVLAAGAALAACGEPQRDYGDEDAYAEPAPVEPAPVPEDTPPTGAAEGDAESDDAYVAPLPEDRRSSEETVQPESETLFY